MVVWNIWGSFYFKKSGKYDDFGGKGGGDTLAVTFLAHCI
jgi:hypothetical protein